MVLGESPNAIRVKIGVWHVNIKIERSFWVGR
jgi:hypothetical protein